MTDSEPSAEPTRRSTRTRNEIDRYVPTHVHGKSKQVKFADQEWQELEQRHNNFDQVNIKDGKHIECSTVQAMVIAQFMTEINERATTEGASFGQQYIFQKGIKKFGKRGSAAAAKELDQLHQRNCWAPVLPSTITAEEKKKSPQSLMFLTEKRDGTIKGRMVYDGSKTREFLSKEDSASPTASLESIMLTAIIDANENRDVMTADIPNAFIQAKIPDTKDGEERVLMKITGVLVDLLVEQAPEIYRDYVVYENGKKVLYVQVLKALYGMLVAALLWYKRFRQDLEDQGYKFNPYEPCVANKLIQGHNHTVRFHVDDLMASHLLKKVNDKFLKWLNKMYGGYGAVKATRGKIHDYLGMTFDFSAKGEVHVDMIDYVENMIDDFSVKLSKKDTAPNPAADDLFAVGDSPKLTGQQKDEFHTFVAKGLFACKRARPDIHPTIAVLCTRVKEPNQDDWNKLTRMMKYLNGTRKDKLILSADKVTVLKWYIDSSFAVHPDFKSHTGAVMTYGRGAPITGSRKQKLNTDSSTYAELVAPHDASNQVLWTKLFMEAQGYPIKDNIVLQDNKSTMKLQVNGKSSSSKRTRAINIRYFFLTDEIRRGNLRVVYCPTTEMIGDYMTKPLKGALFEKFRRLIMGH